MKKIVITLLAIGLTLGLANAQSKKDKPAAKTTDKNTTKKEETKMATTETLKTELDSVSYGLGLLIAQNLKQQGLDELNFDLFSKALAQSFKNEKTSMDINAANSFVNEYFMGMQAKKGQKNLEAGQKFLAENKNKKGVITLPSGLQYEIITEGNGPKPTATDKVTTHYHGTLIDGTVFDSSVQRGQPATFPVNGVIQGWVEALQLMPVGSKWRLYVPSNLAYGERGAGANIGPNTTLIFEVELISIN